MPLQPPRPPPTLSFKAFHAAHFSAASRLAFFGQPHVFSESIGWHSFPSTVPTAGDTEPAISQIVNDEEQRNTLQDTASVPYNEAENEAINDEALLAGNEELMLSKEAIEIFEFSRKFRLAKAEAAQEEEARLKRRKLRRKKLTRLGFAPNDGDSDAEEDIELTGTAEGEIPNGNIDSEDDDDDTDDDDGNERPATDVSFMAFNERQRTKRQSQLYGHNASKDSSGLSVAHKLTTIDTLEALLNQQYENSLKSTGSAHLET
ncbi:hypothetical protein BGZ94_003148, partial [Podila epigama]